MNTQEAIAIESLYAASDAGGAYLEKVGQTDLVKLTNKQWMAFIETVIRAFETARNELTVEMPY